MMRTPQACPSMSIHLSTTKRAPSKATHRDGQVLHGETSFLQLLRLKDEPIIPQQKDPSPRGRERRLGLCEAFPSKNELNF